MTNNKEELLAAFDAVWSHPWESLETIVKDVSEEEAWYQHPIYSKEEREVGHPPSGSILWHVVHLGHCYKWYKELILAMPERPPEPSPPEAKNLAEGIANLKLCRGNLRECISNLRVDKFTEKIYNGSTISDQARMIVRHDAWHGGQIAVARRLYRMRDIP